MKRNLLQTITILAFLFLSPNFGYGEEDPERLINLRGSFEREIERVNSPVISKYVVALKVLQANYTKANNLSAALAVKKEIEKAEGQSASKEDVAKKEKEIERELRKFLLKNEFSFFFFSDRSKDTTFLRDGRIGKGGNPSEYSWELKNGELYLFNSKKENTFIFTYRENDKSLRTSETPHQFMTRHGYLVLKK